MTAPTISDRTQLDLLLLRSLAERAHGAFGEGHEVGTMTGLLVADMTSETAIRLAISHLHSERDLSRESLQKLLGDLVSEIPALSIHENAIKRLRKDRNPVQHGASVPASGGVALHLKAMDAFLADVVKLVFGVDLTTISAVNLVQDPEIRNALATALDSIQAGDMDAAVLAAAGAFEAFRIVWARWDRRARGINRADEEFRGQVFSLVVDSQSSQRSLEPMVDDDSSRSAASITMGLPVPMVARWQHLVQVASGRDDADSDPVTPEELKYLIDRFALLVWSKEGSHPGLLDDEVRPT